MRSNKRAHDRVQQHAMNVSTAASIASAAASRHQVRGCANCGRLDTSRDGPTGRESLCDMFVLFSRSSCSTSDALDD